jgi:4-aminobutyrate aminotransferase-like enzyme
VQEPAGQRGRAYRVSAPARPAGSLAHQSNQIVRLSRDFYTTTKLVNGLRRKRVLISAAGPSANVLKVRPPIVFAKSNVDHFIRALDEILTEDLSI